MEVCRCIYTNWHFPTNLNGMGRTFPLTHYKTCIVHPVQFSKFTQFIFGGALLTMKLSIPMETNSNEKKKQFVVLLQIGKWNAIICAPLALFVFILVYSECIFYSPIPNVSSPEEMPEFNRMKKQTFSRWLGKKPRPASRTIKKLRLWKCETLCKCLKFELEKIAKWEN